jgi:hypothetical protein
VSNLKTPAQCGQLAEDLIVGYVNECGAQGDADGVAKVLEMLISKAALGIAFTSGGDRAQQVLFRTMANVEALIQKNATKGTVQ